MEQKEFTNKKYPKSSNKFQCLGPCYRPGTKIVHPTYLDIVTDTINPFCPVKEWEYVDDVTKKSQQITTDICFNPTANTSVSNQEIELNILTPYIDFDSAQFLKIYYDIYSFEDSVDWCNKNSQTPIDTQIRIMKSSLSTFGKSMDIVDHRFIDFFIILIKKKFMVQLYDSIHSYVHVNASKGNTTISLGSSSINSLKKSDHFLERTNYIIKTFINDDYLHKFIMRYFMNRKNVWDTIADHITNMVYDFIDYVINKINLTIK